MGFSRALGPQRDRRFKRKQFQRAGWPGGQHLKLEDTRGRRLGCGEGGWALGSLGLPPTHPRPEHEADAALWVRCQCAGLPSFRGQRRAFVGRGRGWLRAQERHCDQSSGQFFTVFPPPGLQVGRGQEPRLPTGVTGTFRSVPALPPNSVIRST